MKLPWCYWVAIENMFLSRKTVFGILISVGLIVFALLANYFGRHFPRVLMFGLTSLAGSLISYSILICLKRGRVVINARGEISIYLRQANPVAFWLYIFLFLLVDILVYGLAIFILFAKLNT